MKKKVYLDHSATTYVRSEARKEMMEYFSKYYGNPGSMNSKGLEAKGVLEKSRQKIAGILNARPEEIIFTGSGTESINLALKGFARANKGSGRHLITSKIEHHAVLDTCEYLEKEEGFEVSYIDVDRDGIVKLDELEKAIRKDTILISIMYANNEIGTIQPINEIVKIAHGSGIKVHTDACQAGLLDLDVERLGVDMMTLNSSKIYGPKGVGMLYFRDVKIQPIIHGGGQEFGLRSGTENIPGIVGFAKALELAQFGRKEESKRLIVLRDRLINGILEMPKTILNGHAEKRLPNNANISILDVEGESLALYLDENGICAATGSACTSENLEPSHVLLALGVPKEIAHGSLRFTLGKNTTKEDIDYVLKKLPGIVERLREISPVELKEE